MQYCMPQNELNKLIKNLKRFCHICNTKNKHCTRSTKVPKLRFSKMLTVIISGPNEQGFIFENLNLSFLSWVGWIMLKQKHKTFFTIFWFHIEKISWFFSLENTPKFILFCQKMYVLCPFITSCFWGHSYCLYCKHY